MFVGILGEGRYEITGSRECTVVELAAELETVADRSPEVFGPVLATLLGVVRRCGTPVAEHGHLDLLLPNGAAHLAELGRALQPA